MRDDIMAVKKEIEKLKEESVAMELLKDARTTNKRIFVIWIVTFLTLVGVACYVFYLKNDSETVTDTIKIDDVDKIDNSHIKIGDDKWEVLR